MPAPSNGRRHCVVTDIVLEEESLGGESKDDVDSSVKEPASILENNQVDLMKEKAPSEHCLDSLNPPHFEHVADAQKESNANKEGMRRSRACSDGSQCRRPGLMPLDKNFLQQLRNVSPTDQQVKSSVLPHSGFSSFSRSQLEGVKLSESSLAPLRRHVISSQKCATSGSKPAVYPFKQVECPF